MVHRICAVISILEHDYLVRPREEIRAAAFEGICIASCSTEAKSAPAMGSFKKPVNNSFVFLHYEHMFIIFVQ